MSNEPPAEPKRPEPKITFTTALLCQQVLKDYRGDLVSVVNIIDSIALERQPEWVEFFALVIARSDSLEPFSADAELSMRYPSGKVVKLPSPEKLGFGTELSVHIRRYSGSKLIIGLKLELTELGNYAFIVSAYDSVAEIPLTVYARAD